MSVESVAQNDAYEFHLGDKVLVKRGYVKNDVWVPAFFGYQNKNEQMTPYTIFGGHKYSHCIPLEGNEGLIGTSSPAPGEKRPVIRTLKQFERFQNVEVNIYDDDEEDMDESDWKPAWYISCTNDPDDMFPHKVLLEEDTETYFVEDCNIRLPKSVEKVEEEDLEK